ncbi:MAG: M1 family metallopeptidase [Acidobacteriota bacterium]
MNRISLAAGTASLLMLLVLAACGDTRTAAPTSDNSTPAAPMTTTDPHSYANFDQVAVSHLSLDIDVDFERSVLDGTASLTLTHHADATELVLDTRDLDIHAVRLDDAKDAVDFTLAPADGYLGAALRIPITSDTRIVHVDYTSQPQAAAVQWLSPQLTSGGEHPFLFTQSQAILARTWVPIQDTPGVRFTYDATVRVPSKLMALMSAENPTEKSADGAYTFSMPQAIPSYLLALAVGDLEFRSIGEDTGVYAEPDVVDAAAWEFADTQDMIDRVEPLYGPYRWGRYDILVLPPSFPFGGMENPRLTFATPTILAGDRSLVALVAHELAHSWSGNLTTNANWNDFWLNEGFTVYLERRIMEEIAGEDYAAMLATLGWQDLDHTLAGLPTRDTHLRLDLAGRDPDDGMTDVAYEKGNFFLRTIEEEVGRERFDAFLRKWFDDNAFKAVTTDGFITAITNDLLSEAEADAIDLTAWIDGPGIPAGAYIPSSDAFTQVDAALTSWQDGTPAAELATDKWTTHEWLHFLRGLPETLDIDQMDQLDQAFGFNATGNSEIKHAWLHHVIANNWEPGYDALERFLIDQGRRKFLKPLYERLATTPDGKDRADKIYEQARGGYHPVSVGTIDTILGWQG